MIQVNFTLLVQLANFLILLVILNYLLFKPVLKILDERERVIRESAEIKENLGELTAKNIEEYESKLLAGKQEAMAIRASERTEAMAGFRKTIQDAKLAGAQDLDAARKEIEAQAEDSRDALMSEAKALAADIAANLMGRKT
ncbi:MAG: ATP synthase F0 subunit B [Pseudomonadota bacterium]